LRPATVLPGGSFLVIAKSPADLQSVYGLSGVLGPYTNNLPNNSGTIRLRNRVGAIFLEVNYGSTPPWPAAADGAGHSLVLARPSLGGDNADAWAAGEAVGVATDTRDLVNNARLRAEVFIDFNVI